MEAAGWAKALGNEIVMTYLSNVYENAYNYNRQMLAVGGPVRGDVLAESVG